MDSNIAFQVVYTFLFRLVFLVPTLSMGTRGASSMNVWLENEGRLIAQPTNGWSSNIALREWWIANYFLLKNNKSFYFYAYSMDVYWWSEYDMDLGAFIQSPTKNLRDLLVEGTQSLYARSYEKGLVLVNPGESSQPYTLEGTYYRYSFSGGGYVAGNTKPEYDNRTFHPNDRECFHSTPHGANLMEINP